MATQTHLLHSIDDTCTQVSCESDQLAPFKILKRHFSEILDVVSDPNRLANDLWGVDLISNVVKDNIISTPSVPRYEKASKLLNEVQRSLKVNENPETLILLCKALTNQKNLAISTICKTMFKELGKLIIIIFNFTLTFTTNKTTSYSNIFTQVCLSMSYHLKSFLIPRDLLANCVIDIFRNR